MERKRAIVKVAAFGLAMTAAGCGSPPADQLAASNAAEPVAAPQPPPRLEDPTLNREQLLLAVVRAASDFAASAPAKPDELDGRRFRFAFRFGCAGSTGEGPRSWSYDQDAGALRVRFDPQVHEGMKPMLAPAANAEAVAGFVVERPWLLTAACGVEQADQAEAPRAGEAPDADGSARPGVPAEASSAADTRPGGGQVLLVHVSTDQDSRVGRPLETYRAVKQLPPEEVPAQGLDLIVEGRLRALAGQVIRCQAAGAAQRPDCLVFVRIDGARLMDPARSAVIAEWSAQ